MMLTRCPACQTVFRLRAEQLRARRGEVRCGHCFHPFNALEHLVESREASAVAATQASAEAASPAIGDAAGTELTHAAFESETGAKTQLTPTPPIALSPEPEQQAPSTEPQSDTTAETQIAAAATDLDFFDITPALSSAGADSTAELTPPAPAAPPAAAAASADTTSPPLFDNLDFDLPEELGREPDTEARSKPGSSFVPRQQEPALDEIDFSSFFDIPTPPPAETHTEPLRPKVELPAFPVLDRTTEDPPATPITVTGNRQDPFGLRPPPADGTAAPADARLPGVIRADRKPAAPVPDHVEEHLAPAPTVEVPAALRDAPRAEPSAGLRHTDNEVETDPPEPPAPSLPPLTATAPDVQHLDRIYGKADVRSNAQRTLWGLAVGLLAGCLLAQGAYLFRTDLTRALPGLRPLLLAACNALACEVPLPREADKIAIIASDLQSEPGRPGRFILHATVRNQADFPQEWPHLELTLTDGGDTPVARRVLSPQEWIAADRLSSAFSARGDIALRQPLSVTDLNPTGYRVYVFYP